MPNFPSSHVTLVTGASTGIGRATAIDFARAGSNVAVHYNSSREAAEEVVKAIEKEGRKAWLFQADVSKAEECRRLVAEVLKACGRIDTLVNNAGALVERKPIIEMSDELWQYIFDLNTSSVFWVTQPVARHMIERGSGAIVNVASIAGRNGGGPGSVAYASSKAALTCFSKGLARELIGHGIRVNAVHPGVILTPFHERFSTPAMITSLIEKIPQGRGGKAEEISKTIVFLASDDASYIVGEAVEINGGMLMD
jgi:3-oxoacyl-[acyl-carrier protein] reductase